MTTSLDTLKKPEDLPSTYWQVNVRGGSGSVQFCVVPS